MSKQITKEQVRKVAQLANLNLSEAELTKFTEQLEEVIDYNVEKLNRVDTEDIEPLLNVSGLESVFREDQVSPSLEQKEVLENAKKTHNGFFEVEAILEQE